MMSVLWVVLFLALAGSHFGYGLPVRPTPPDYPLDGSNTFSGWAAEGGVYAAIPVLALVVTAAVLLFGCTWCYRHKDCKLFTASAQHLQAAARVVPPDSGFSEPANNNISEDNNNGPISLREMQNIANNNAAAYIVSENEERNRISRESVVEFEPLPTGIIGADPLERCADWFAGEDFPRSNLQYLREIDRGWYGRVVEGEIEEAGASSSVAVKILNQNATLEDKARFLDENKMYRDIAHENILAFIGKCLTEDPWILLFELCPMDLQQYLTVNRPRMAALNESGVPLRLMCDISSALAYLHSRGYVYGGLWSGSVLVRTAERGPRAVLGRYVHSPPQHEYLAPEVRHSHVYTTSSEIWSLGTLIWEVCSWGGAPPAHTAHAAPPPDLPCPYKSHLYQVMQLCWAESGGARASAAQVHALVAHLAAAHAAERAQPQDHATFEARWQCLKPNSIPKHDEHVAIVHTAAGSLDAPPGPLDAPPAVGSRASSAASHRLAHSDSLTNLHGSLDDVRNIYLTHGETAAHDCHQGNTLHDAALDPWLEDIIAGSHDDVSYYRDVSDVIKNLDNILNSEKTSSSESSHQASPSRDNLSLDCKKEYPPQSSLVKSPGITDFQHIMEAGFAAQAETADAGDEEELERDTAGTLSHSFERHSDCTSQHTLENLTPDTPMRDIEVFVDVERLATDAEISEIDSQIKSVEIEQSDTIVDETETAKSTEREDDIPKEVVDGDVFEKEQCASTASVSDHERSPSKDCQTPCDSTDVRTEDQTKSIDEVREDATGSMPLHVIEVTDSVENVEKEESVQGAFMPLSADESTINEGVETLPSVTEEVSTHEQDGSLPRLEDTGPASMDSEHHYSKDETLLLSDRDPLTDTSRDEPDKLHLRLDIEPVPLHTLASVQNITKDATCQEPDLKLVKKADSAIKLIEVTPTHLPPEIVQNTDKDATVTETENLVCKRVVEVIKKLDDKDSEVSDAPRSDSLVEVEERPAGPNMDLINDTSSRILTDSTGSDKPARVANSEPAPPDDSALSKDESTQYLDLPSFSMIQKTSDFLQIEKMIAAYNVENKLVSSTPIGSDKSGDLLDSFGHGKEEQTMIIAKTMIPLYESTNPEQKCLENMSPFDSPSHRSHHTDTYDENSSVVLGPFENSEVLRSGKPNIEPVELPREELLAFSSNFSEINLETPSPLRDGNFLNEVPDIAPDLLFDDLASISEPKDVEGPSEDTESGSGTQKRVSPSTPPNSPGVSLAGTSQEKYAVDIDLNADVPEPDSPIRSIDLNQIELQITSKLAMAENENNLNIEYSGPLTVEGLIEEGGSMRESDAMPELYLAGNGGSVEDVRELLSLNEECVQALRNELELKLPLAQVAGIEPALEAEGWGELPPPPELVLTYPPALSPIQEETAPQLSAYENDTPWNPSTRTESSESYPEPCNNSTDSATSLPRADTYTVQRAHPPPPPPPHDLSTSKEITMSVDSLNNSVAESGAGTGVASPTDRTYTIEEERLERLSQVSPCLVSPTADTDTGDDTRLSTLSRTTLPTDAKHSRPSEGLSKATSIDSWCSNDTLYNVEENFDEVVLEGEPRDEPARAGSASSDTLTHDDDSRASFLAHESERDAFSPDSIAPDQTYTKPEPAPGASLTYGNLGEAWRPDLMRRSPHNDCDLTPPKHAEEKESDENPSPQVYERRLSRMESVEISCFTDHSVDSPARLDAGGHIVPAYAETVKPNGHVGPHTSTPLVEPVTDTSDVDFAMNMAEFIAANSGISSNVDISHESNEEKPQNIDSKSTPSEELLEGTNKILSQERSNLPQSEASLNYLEFENSVASKPQNKIEWESGPNYSEFENSAVVKPQDQTAVQSSSIVSESKNLAPESPNNVIVESLPDSIPQIIVESEASPRQSTPLNSDESPDITHDSTKSDRSPTYSEFENSAAVKPQEKAILDRSPTYSEFEHSAESKPQDKERKAGAEHTTTYSEFETSAAVKPQDKTIIERSTTYSDFENSAAFKPQENKTVTEGSTTYSDFENSAAFKPQENKTITENSTTYSEFENSAAFKLQENKSITESSTTYSDFENSAAAKPQENRAITDNSTTYSNFENSAALKPQETTVLERSPTGFPLENGPESETHNKSFIDKSSQSMESGISSEEFRSFENSVKGRPQDLSSLIDASSMLLNSERMYSDIESQPHSRHGTTPTNGEVTPAPSQHITPPSILYPVESHQLAETREPSAFLINLDLEDETEQPHSIIVTELSLAKTSPNKTYDSHVESTLFDTFNSHVNRSKVYENSLDFDVPEMNGGEHEQPESLLVIDQNSSKIENQSITNHVSPVHGIENSQSNDIKDETTEIRMDSPKASTETTEVQNSSKEVNTNGGSEKFATVHFLNENFEELVESSVDDSDGKDQLIIDEAAPDIPTDCEEPATSEYKQDTQHRLPSTTESHSQANGVPDTETKLTTLTEDFLQNEKKYATLDSYFPLLSDIRFTGPASEMMSTSFQDSPTSPNSPECEQDSKPSAADILKEWDSDSESHSSNSSSGEFIWKDGAGHETALVPTTNFDHQRGSTGGSGGGNSAGGEARDGGSSGASSGSGDSGSGSEGDEVEFVPSSWDCRLTPAKSSLRSLEQATPESKKRVVFKRQKYHCVYEYPREAADTAHSPAFLPDLSTYCEWDPSSAEDAELCYGQLFASPGALHAAHPLRAAGPFGTDYDEDFFISSSARPFESLGIMSTASQFFPGGLHTAGGKRALLERSLSDEGFPAPPLTAPELGFTTPDSGVEDITPGSTLELDLAPKKLEGTAWRADSGSSSESVSPSSPGELGGLRHTRDRLKLDLPPSPHAASPRHARVFSFTAAPRRRADTPLALQPDTLPEGAPLPAAEPEPTFSTFGKSPPRLEGEQRLILTDAAEPEPKGEPTPLDSGDEDSGIESSSKATLERAPDLA